MPPGVYLIAVAGLLALLGAAPASAQAPDRDQSFIEYLRRQDPAAAERFVTLRNARDAALADLNEAAQRYSAGGPALRPVSLPALQKARRRYADASLALLDFLDERDRATIAKLEADVERVKHSIEARGLDREKIEKLLHE
jgi:hypothetical protein